LSLAGWFLVAISMVAIWKLACQFASYAVACPETVLYHLLNMDLTTIVHAMTITLSNTFAGFILASIAAYTSIFIGITHPILWSFFASLNVLVQSVSILIWALLGLAIFGVASRLPAILVAFAASYPILLSSLLTSVERLRKRYWELSKMLKLNKLQELVYILVPGSLPAYISAARSAFGVALRVSVVAEAFGASGGVGYMLMLSYSIGDLVDFYTWALLLIMLMLFVDRVLFYQLERLAMRWVG